MSKNKKFDPPVGFILKVHNGIFHVRLLADKLGLSEFGVAQALDDCGLMLTEDVMGISGDVSKVMILQAKNGTDLKVVKDEQPSANASDGREQIEGTES